MFPNNNQGSGEGPFSRKKSSESPEKKPGGCRIHGTGINTSTSYLGVPPMSGCNRLPGVCLKGPVPGEEEEKTSFRMLVEHSSIQVHFLGGGPVSGTQAKDSGEVPKQKVLRHADSGAAATKAETDRFSGPVQKKAFLANQWTELLKDNGPKTKTGDPKSGTLSLPYPQGTRRRCDRCFGNMCVCARGCPGGVGHRESPGCVGHQSSNVNGETLTEPPMHLGQNMAEHRHGCFVASIFTMVATKSKRDG